MVPNPKNTSYSYFTARMAATGRLTMFKAVENGRKKDTGSGLINPDDRDCEQGEKGTSPGYLDPRYSLIL